MNEWEDPGNTVYGNQSLHGTLYSKTEKAKEINKNAVITNAAHLFRFA